MNYSAADDPSVSQSRRVHDYKTVRCTFVSSSNPDCATSALYLAVESGHQAVAETLICYGANLSTATYSGATPASLCSAAELKRSGAVSWGDLG